MMRSIFSMNFKIKNNTLPGITRILRNMHHGGFPAQAMDLINPLMQNPSVHARQSSHHYHVSSVQVLQDISAFTQENIHSTLTVTFPNNEQSILLKVSMVLYMIEAVKIYFWIPSDIAKRQRLQVVSNTTPMVFPGVVSVTCFWSSLIFPPCVFYRK